LSSLDVADVKLYSSISYQLPAVLNTYILPTRHLQRDRT